MDTDLPKNGYHGSDIKDIAQRIKEEVENKYLNVPEKEMIFLERFV